MTAERFLYLTTIGRVSGLPRTIEIWFVEHVGHHYVVSERGEQAGWVKNIVGNPRVRFYVGTRNEDGRTVSAVARMVRDSELAEAVLARMTAKYGWGDGLIVELAVADP